MNHSLRSSWPVYGPWLVLAVALGMMLAAACANHGQVFAGNGNVNFVDPDCYSRMTRVRAVCDHPGEVLRAHDFENYPFGTQPHTTVPFDYTVYALRFAFLPWCGARSLDLAGAWISPLLGLATIGALWLATGRARLPGQALGLMIFAASPIVAHGFALGRPDHQSLILLCMAGALSAEWQLWRAPSRAWGIVSGVAWALGLWTSLYEPTILLALTLLAALIWNRPTLRHRARWPGLAVGGGILALALCIEGWRISAPPGFGEGGAAEYFSAWTRQIGELASVYPWASIIYHWTGFGLLAAPILLWLSMGDEKPLARANALLLLAALALTCWQIRWGYFLPLVYALGLPWQTAGIPARWRPLAVAALVLGLWPLASEWWGRWQPSPATVESLTEQRAEANQLREAAAFIRQASTLPPVDAGPASDDPPAAGVLAPWWLSPALVYWSGQPAVAGSSHEALPGTVDAARFFMATDARVAARILARRRVRWVVAYEPSRVQGTSADLLGLRPPPPRFMDLVLYERPQLAPRYLRPALVNSSLNPYFKIYEVTVGSLPHD